MQLVSRVLKFLSQPIHAVRTFEPNIHVPPSLLKLQLMVIVLAPVVGAVTTSVMAVMAVVAVVAAKGGGRPWLL